MLYWTLDTEAQLIHIGIEAAAQGWVGFGISEVGGMKGADIFYFETETGIVVDTHATAYARPMVDDCQDWVLRSGGVEDGKLYLEVTRQFDTGDTQDWKLVDDTGTNGHRFIAAWGDSVSFGYHGTDNRDSGKIHFFGTEPPIDKLQAIKDMPGVEHRDLLYSDWTIPAITTKYHDVCWNVQELLGVQSSEEPFHIVAFEPILNPADWKYMHHVTISGSTEVYPGERKHDGYCKHSAHGDGALIMAWAGERSSIILPSDAGIRIMGEGWRSFGVQTHFNNPAHDPDVKANSGIRVWYTRTLRPMDVGVLQIGDPGVVLSFWEKVEMEAGWHSVHTKCPSKFTNQFTVPEVTVFARFMHMHLAGERFEARLKRNGELVRVDSTEVYDGLKSGGFDPMSTRGGFKVRRGDTFEVDCYYHVDEGRTVKFGQGTEDEMCIDFLWYYPKQPLKGAEACVIHGSNEGEYLGPQTQANASETGRVFGVPPAACTEPPADSDAVKGSESGASGGRSRGPWWAAAVPVMAGLLVGRT